MQVFIQYFTREYILLEGGGESKIFTRLLTRGLKSHMIIVTGELSELWSRHEPRLGDGDQMTMYVKVLIFLQFWPTLTSSNRMIL